jgi:hypothetical protein
MIRIAAALASLLTLAVPAFAQEHVSVAAQA